MDTATTGDLLNYLRATGAWTRTDHANPAEGRGARAPDCRIAGVPTHMKVTRRQFVKGGVAAFTVTFAAPEVLHRAGGAGTHAQPGRAQLERRQRLAEHADSLQRSVLHEPPAVARGAGRAGPAGWNRFVRRRARSPPAADRHARHLQSGPARVRAAHRLRKPEPVALPGHRHLVHGRSEQFVGVRLGGTLSRFAAVARRSAGRLEHDRVVAARADGGAYIGPGDLESRDLRVREPEHRRRGGGRAGDRGADFVARADRSPGAGVRVRQRAGRARHARSRRHRRHVCAVDWPIPTPAWVWR